MPWVGFEHTTPALERAKTVHNLDSAATVIDYLWLLTAYCFGPVSFPWSHWVVMRPWIWIYKMNRMADSDVDIIV
jgi:hypothetical protein